MGNNGVKEIKVDEGIIASRVGAIRDEVEKLCLKKISSGSSRSEALSKIVEVYGELGDVLSEYSSKLNQDLTTITKAVSTMADTDSNLSDSVHLN